jgi:hypothetical protein
LPRLSPIGSMLADFHYAGLEWQTLFESLDGFNVSDPVHAYFSLGILILDTAAALNDEQYIQKMLTYSRPLSSWTKNCRMITTIDWGEGVLTKEAYVGIGVHGGAAHVGFKIVNGDIYGSVGSGAAETLTASLATLGGANHLDVEARFVKGVGAYFYIDGVLVGTKTTGLPSTGNRLTIFEAWVKATAAATRAINLSWFKYLQEP